MDSALTVKMFSSKLHMESRCQILPLTGKIVKKEKKEKKKWQSWQKLLHFSKVLRDRVSVTAPHMKLLRYKIKSPLDKMLLESLGTEWRCLHCLSLLIPFQTYRTVRKCLLGKALWTESRSAKPVKDNWTHFSHFSWKANRGCKRAPRCERVFARLPFIDLFELRFARSAVFSEALRSKPKPTCLSQFFFTAAVKMQLTKLIKRHIFILFTVNLLKPKD